jgi:4-amino-4-deoxy-L-arabinose transferase-like glycosyltransferase
MKSNRIFYLFLIALFLLFFLPNLLQRGMFVDGLWYSTISKNLADGLGSFWYPCFTRTMFPVFNEHPPLVFGIQSFFFELLGDSEYVEKVYALFIIIITLILIHILWRVLLVNKPQYKNFGFIPGILWILHETTYLYYPNNLLECTQGVFILITVILIIKGLHNLNNFSYLYMSIAGISLILSFLSKGFTGLYPLITIILYHFTVTKIPIKKLIIYNTIFFGSFCLIILLFLINKSASENIYDYINTQVIAAMKGERTENMQSSRFHILRVLFETSILPLVVVLILTLSSYLKNRTGIFLKFRKEFYFFIVLGLSGVLPMMVSMKQGTYYLLTVIPYISIALSLVVINSDSILNKLRVSIAFKIVTYSLLIFSIIYPLFSINTINKRDRTLLTDLDQFSEVVEHGQIMGCITDKYELSLYAYFMRNYSVSLDTANPYNYNQIVCDKQLPFDSTSYKPIDIQTEKFYLLQKRYH